MSTWLFLAAYTSSGFAGLVYEVAWTRLLTLYLGHSTAAVSTVVAAFMGGLAVGAAFGGRAAARLERRQALHGYVILEAAVAVTALAMPWALSATGPLLVWAYQDGAPGLLFPVVRVAVCFALLLVPTMALGATFPFGVRWFVAGHERAGRAGGSLYAANTFGAAAGALVSAFVLLPAVGTSGATAAAVGAGGLAIALALICARGAPAEEAPQPAAPRLPGEKTRSRSRRGHAPPRREAGTPPPAWLGFAILAMTGAATLLLEIAWTRVFASIIGPTTYAFAATLTGVIGGLAAGSAAGAVLAGITKRPALPLALALGCAALAATWVSSTAGHELPLRMLAEFAGSTEPFGDLLRRQAIAIAILVVPPAVGLGVAYPLALALVAASRPDVARRLGSAYAVNTVASVAGSLGAGFLAIPLLGFERTLALGSGLCAAAALTAAAAGRLSVFARVSAVAPVAAAAWLMAVAPPWDRELLASGGYKYANRLPKDVDPATALKAGRLLHYSEGPTGIVSVRQLTGERSLAIDGKVDASTAGDMLTQKALAHLPLLLHEDPHTVCIIGLGSGITLASALSHPVTSVDVVEISPDVVDASRHFAVENRNALSDPRSRLIAGDGRSHLAWSSRQYDVIISEPSNPWMAGVAALFTREFFEAVRARLAPLGIFCQWAHTYDISEADLRSIVETFRSVFPDGTMWLAGDGDLLLVGSAGPLEPRLANVETAWRRPGVAGDLRDVSLLEPFGLWSLYAGGPAELEAYGAGAPYQTDNRMGLEFSGPGALNSTASAANARAIRQLLDHRERPAVIARSLASSGAAQWRDRAAMMLQAGSYDASYDDYAAALTRDPSIESAHEGFVRAAVAARRQGEAAALLRSAAAGARTIAPRIALSKLLAATGAFDEALAAARDAVAAAPANPAGLEQVASLFADAGDAARLDPVVEGMRRLFPGRAATMYYGAASAFLRERLPDALTLARQAVELDPARAASRNLLGAIHASLQQRAEAREAFEAALRLDARDASAYNNLALLELAAGNTGTARDLFAEALSLDPGSSIARQGLLQTH